MSSTERVILIPAREGRGFVVKKGEIMRISGVGGPQVADFNAFSYDNPNETFNASVTRRMEGAHLSEGSRLWSRLPYANPMFLVRADTLQTSDGPAKHHDVLFPTCSMGTTYRSSPTKVPNCYDNLCEAAGSLGLDPMLVHDPFNIFMKTGVDERGGLYYAPPDTTENDFVELEALMDCYVCISACPSGCNDAEGGTRGLQVILHPGEELPS